MTGLWKRGLGPALPLEFSRISAKRFQALAVCIDPVAGGICPTCSIQSTRTSVDDAVADLAARERAPVEKIGFVNRASCTMATQHAELGGLIRDWCEANHWDGAVWTDLDSNFSAMLGRPFSPDEGNEYLRTLKGQSLDEAVRYISEAPVTTRTPLRRRLEAEPWWQRERSRLGI